MLWRNLLLCLFLTVQLIACDNNIESVRIESNPIPAPTSATIVYTSNREESFHLRVSNSDYSDSYRITSFGLAMMPDWSPDKQWITYVKAFQIWKMRYDGTEKQVLTDDDIEAQAPRFSADGQNLIFAVSKPRYGFTLCTVPSDRGQVRQVIVDSVISSEGEYSFIWPDWSPDGKRICFSYARLDTNFLRSYIGILNLSTGGFSRLPWTPDSLLPAEPRWSPRGDELLVTCGLEEGGIDIWRVNVDRTDPVRMTHTTRSRAPEWSGDGEYFLYETHINKIRTLWKMKRDGTENEQITIDGDPYVGEPAW